MFPTVFRILVLLILLLCASQLCADSLSSQQPLTIDSIIVYGNKRTREHVVNAYLGLTKGMKADSAALQQAKRQLKNSGLFRTVELVPHQTPTGIRLYVILVENQYLTISDIGGTLYETRYGKSVPLWWTARLGAGYKNFRGRQEVLGVHLTFWRASALSISWTKPFVSSPYYVSLSAGVSYRPDVNIELQRFSLRQRTTVGRKIGKRSKAYVSFLPTYNRNEWRGPNGKFIARDTIVGDTSEIRGPQSLDTSWTDTVQSSPGTIVARTWRGYGSDEIRSLENFYRELFLIAGWATDQRDRRFNPHKGYYLGIRLKTNLIFPHDWDSTYTQFDIESRFYHRGILDKHTVAYRFQPSLRIGTSKRYDGLYAGGESTLRGYSLGYFGRRFLANNRVVGSVEYRIPTVSTPPLTYPLLSQFHPGLRDFYYRIDVAGFVDGGYLWKDLTSPLNPYENHEYGLGAGCGIRIMGPTIGHSGCIDFGWSVDPDYRTRVKETYYRRMREYDKGLRSKKPRGFWWPDVYLYLDMYF